MRYFIGANTSDGFRDLTGDVFSRAGRLIIIKGGPGTGKSSLMREIAAEAESRNMGVEYYYCSSDASSLDGIYVRDADFSITDGTSPHQRDPVCPGAVDEIVNLGEFWDASMLTSSAGRILELSQEKSRLYASVRHLLKANGEVIAERNGLLKSAIDMQKLDTAVRRSISKLHTPENGKAEPRQVSGIGMNGYTYFPTYERNCGTVLSVSDRYGVSGLVFRKFDEVLRENGVRFCKTFDPRADMAISGIMIPSCSLAIVSRNEYCENADVFNPARFILPPVLREIRQKLRAYSDISDAILKETADVFEKIKETHFAIEKIYIDAMDFRQKEEYTSRLIHGIFQ